MIPVAPLASRVALGSGDQACCLLLEVAGRRSRSGTRQTVRGVARVRVESIEGDVFHVVVLAASGGRVGEQLTYPRAALYATRGDEWRASEELGVPPAAAVRLMGVTVRFCAAVLSQDGVIQWASPSLRLLGFMDVSRFPEGKPIGAGALARRFVDTGRLRRDPDLVPVSAWIDGVSDDTWIQEHSMPTGQPGTVLTMLWAPNEPDVPRELTLPPRLVPSVRDIYLSDEATRIAYHRAMISPCPVAPTWLDVLLGVNLRAAG